MITASALAASALANTGSNDLVPLIAGIALGIVVLGGALLIVRAVLARRANKG